MANHRKYHKNDQKDNYYIYGLFDVTKKVKLCCDDKGVCLLYEPFYIGKGQKERLNDHFQQLSLKEKNYKNNAIKKLIKNNTPPTSNIIIQGLDEKYSYELESKIIKTLGRRNIKTGILTNLTDGGEGGTNAPKKTLWKKVDKICPTTFKVLKTYKSIAEAAKKNNIKYSGCISTCCNKKGKIIKGFIWRFHGEKVENDFIYKKNTVKINVYDLDKKLLKTTKSIHEASKIYNEPEHIISRLICGIGNPIKYLYEYYDDELKNKYNVLERDKYHQHTKKVCLVENNNDIVKIYDSLVECSNELNISTKVINKHCNNNLYTNISYNLYYYDSFVQGYRKTYHKKRNSEVKIYSIDIKSGEIINYNSTTEAIRKGFNGMSLKKYLKLGTKYKGFLWYYGEKVL